VCGTGFEVLPVLSIDRHAIGGGKPGEITTLVRNAYLNVARGEEPKYRHWLAPVYPKDGPGAQSSPKESSTLQHGSDGPPLFRILHKVTDP